MFLLQSCVCVSQASTRTLTNGTLWSTGRTNTWSKAQTSSRSSLPSERPSHAAVHTCLSDCWLSVRRVPPGYHPEPCGTVPERLGRACEGRVGTYEAVRRHKKDHLYLTSRTVFSPQINRVYVYILCMCTKANEGGVIFNASDIMIAVWLCNENTSDGHWWKNQIEKELGECVLSCVNTTKAVNPRNITLSTVQSGTCTNLPLLYTQPTVYTWRAPQKYNWNLTTLGLCHFYFKTVLSPDLHVNFHLMDTNIKRYFSI